MKRTFAEKTAGIIIIGNEILSGMVQDQNAPFMARQLRQSGIELRQVTVIPDNVEEIARVVMEFSRKYDFVFTSGGLGPTHDDVTVEGVSEAFLVKPVLNTYLASLIHERFGSDLNTEQLKMALVPQGADLIGHEMLRFPLIRYGNVFLYPGVPKLLKEKLFVTLQHIEGCPTFYAKIFIDDRESEVAPLLNEVVEDNEETRIGSYLVEDQGQFLLLLTLESHNKLKLDVTLSDLIDRFPKEKIIRVEH